MNLETTREFCLSLPHVTEKVQWVDALLFQIGGKMFAVASLEPDRTVLSFKATSDQFFELQEREGIIPAPYMARNQWVALERWNALRDVELRELLSTSYRLVFEKLPVRMQLELQSGRKKGQKKVARKSTTKTGKKSPRFRRAKKSD